MQTDLCKFKASLVYEFQTARTVIKRDPVLKNQENLFTGSNMESNKREHKMSSSDFSYVALGLYTNLNMVTITI